jgi:gamma-glutamyl hercynylcysteine S-oxide synthase
LNLVKVVVLAQKLYGLRPRIASRKSVGAGVGHAKKTDYSQFLMEAQTMFSNMKTARTHTVGAAMLLLILGLLLLGSYDGFAPARAATPAPTVAPKLGDLRTDAKGVPMVYVPAGLFMMGNNDFVETMPAHRQAISNDFWLDLTPLTNAQYATFVAAGGYQKREYWTSEGWAWLQANNISGPEDENGFTEPDQPRVNISWYEAYAYGQWRGVRLPTEAEWEYAARGPESRIYPWGNSFIDDVVIWNGNYSRVTAKVGAGIRQRGASWAGALDMAGNVWQWTSSQYRPYPYRATDGRERPVLNKTNVLRGCSLSCGPDLLLSAYRGYNSPDAKFDTIGVRYVSPLDTTPTLIPIQLGSRFTDAKGIEMVYVPPGKFLMGSDNSTIGSDDSREHERPIHPQTISAGFWLDLTPLTNAQYAVFIAAGGYKKQEYWTPEGWAWLQAENITGPKDRINETNPDQPRVGISWYEAYAYGQWRGVRLPTEVEWEWAARGPENRIYPWGDEFINNVAVVISIENFMGTDTEIGADIRVRGASWVDALDMVGIVEQWTSSLYQPYPYQAGDKRENLAASGHRVVRGCGYACSNNNLRGAFRSYFPSDSRYTIGVRYVRPLVATSSPAITPTPQLGSRFTDAKGVPMVYVPAGQFVMGSDNSERSDEKPAHLQIIGEGFWLDLTEVTNAQYEAFIKDGGYQQQAYWTAEGWLWLQAQKIAGPENMSGFTEPNQPRVGVSWYEAYAYAKWRGCRLPTEAEWEYAARGPENRIYPWGNTFIDDVRIVIYDGNDEGNPAKVGAGIREGGASWVGALDMVGNVWEWTNSIHDQEKFPYPYQTHDGREDVSGANARAVRGASWDNQAVNIWAAFRARSLPHRRYWSFGLRVACSEPIG